MTILDKIVANKRIEVDRRKEQVSVRELEQRAGFDRKTISMKEALLREGSSGVIAEFKRRSPSKGDIFAGAVAEEVTTAYVKAGAAALSVLTDEVFFGGSDADLMQARRVNSCPILRKDFVIDEYQVVEARAIGADVILLIAECLEKDELRQLARRAKSLGMEILMEIHSADQLDKYCEYVDLVGVNNRNLKDFSVSIRTSLELYKALPEDAVRISESGLSDPNAVVELRRAGYRGFLIGETFMATGNPGPACGAFIGRVKRIEEILNGGIAM